MIISNKELQTNEQIRDSKVRLIDADGLQVGIVPIKKAMDMAIKANLDLVKIPYKAEPPVCKIMDYGKYKFDMAKKEKESKRNQRTSSVKEVRISMNIDINDLNTKVNHAKRFAEDGDKIKVSMRLKGRELGHVDIGRNLMMNFADMWKQEKRSLVIWNAWTLMAMETLTMRRTAPIGQQQKRSSVHTSTMKPAVMQYRWRGLTVAMPSMAALIA